MMITELDAQLDALCRAVIELVTPVSTDAAQQAHHLHERFFRPMVVGIVGRVGSGKSTLVNALVGRQVAATAAEDCTRHVTRYRYGAPEGAVAVRPDGTRVPIALDWVRGAPDSSAVAAAGAVAAIEVSLQSAVLEQLEIVDTPGVQGLLDDAGPAVRSALAETDLLVHLFRGTMRADDDELAADFQSSAAGIAPCAENAIGLLAHADNFGDGGWNDSDPIEQARVEAKALTGRMRSRYATVLPLAGLLAQTSRTGAVTESDLRVLRRLREVDATELQFALTLGGALDVDVDRARLAHILEALAPYGLCHGREMAGDGVQLLAWLEERSGILELTAQIDEVVRPTIRVARAEQLLEGLRDLLAFDPARRPALDRVERAWLSEPGRRVMELRSYRTLVQSRPNSSLVQPLRKLISCADRDERRDAAKDLAGGRDLTGEASRYQALAGMSRHAAESSAARALSAAYLDLLPQAGTAGPEVFHGRR